MAVATMDRKIRRNVYRKTPERRQIYTQGAGNLFLGLGRFLAIVFQWILGLTAVLAISLVILLGYRWVTNHDFFRLEDLKINGGQHLSTAEIAGLAQVHQGSNVLSLNIAEIQRQIASSPWVKAVSVTRVLPKGLVIDIQEHEPFFITRQADHLFYADARGQSFAAVEVEKFIALPFLEKEDGLPVSAEIDFLFNAIGRNTLPFGQQQIAWVRQDSAEQFSLFLEEPRMLIQLDGHDLGATLTALGKIWADLENRRELDKIVSIFVMPNRAWLRFNEG